MTIDEQCYKLYKEAKKNLEMNDPHLEDEVIVALWESAKDLVEENTELKRKTSNQERELAIYYHKVQMLETQLAIANGTYSKEIVVTH